jgi:hypothetical protein
MSKKNLRHFLELCHQSVVEYENSIKKDTTIGGFPIISIEQQAEAAKYTSRIEIERICGLGQYGSQLEKIVFRLGKIFKLKQLVKSQSEPEITHFSIKMLHNSELDERVRVLLNQSQLWNILFDQDATKNKSSLALTTDEWQLSPILSPFFTISYRKIRKIDFTVNQIETIFIANDDEFEKLIKDFANKWKSDEQGVVSSNNLSLFGDDI